MRSTRWIALLAFAAQVAFGSSQAQTVSNVAYPSIAPAEQATRDNERLRILQDELKAEQEKAIDSTKRRAERLAAQDPQGVQEAELAHSRATGNIAALQREIASASAAKQPKGKGATASAAMTQARASAALPSVEAQVQAPWWDVYGKSPRKAAPASITQPAAGVSDVPAAAAVRADLVR